jgi:hypothetical protein
MIGIRKGGETMKRIVLLVILPIATSVTVLGQGSGEKSDKDEKEKQEVVALATEYANALVKRDWATMERSLSDDYGDINTGACQQPKLND